MGTQPIQKNGSQGASHTAVIVDTHIAVWEPWDRNTPGVALQKHQQRLKIHFQALIILRACI